MNVVYSYFITSPNELRHDVRKNFESYLDGTIDDEEDESKPDDRPIDQQAAGMMDQLALMEEMMGTSTFTDVIERRSGEPPPEEWTRQQESGEPPPPAFPTYRLD